MTTFIKRLIYYITHAKNANSYESRKCKENTGLEGSTSKSRDRSNTGRCRLPSKPKAYSRKGTVFSLQAVYESCRKDSQARKARSYWLRVFLLASLLFFISYSIAYQFSGLPATFYCQDNGINDKCLELMRHAYTGH